MAFGATPAEVVRLVIAEGLGLPLIGLASGLGLALGLTRLMTHLLFEVSAIDPATFVAVGVLLAIVALAACWIPARRAASVDPMVALRCD